MARQALWHFQEFLTLLRRRSGIRKQKEYGSPLIQHRCSTYLLIHSLTYLFTYLFSHLLSYLVTYLLMQCCSALQLQPHGR